MTDSIVEAVFEHARRRPEAPALFFADQTISYGRLAAMVEQFARALRRQGLQPGERVALFLGNCPAFVVAYLGTHLAGGIVVLVNTQYRQVELRHILTDAGVQLCVTSAAGREHLLPLSIPTLKTLVIVDENAALPELKQPANSDPALHAETHEHAEPILSSGVQRNDSTLEIIDLLAFLVQDEESQPATPFAFPLADTPAVIGYTSGTTGLSKGALLLHRNFSANIRSLTSAWQWTERDRLLLVLPLFHAHGLMVGLHGTLFTGGSAIVLPKFEASEALRILRSDPGISLFFGVPTMYIRLLAEAERQGVPSHPLRLFVSGSAPLSSQVFADFARLFGQPILERYGMTETIMNLTNPYAGERRAGTVGAPFPGQEARIVERETRQPLPPGEIGEIEVRGPHVFAGYWNRPDATAEAFTPDGWFKTGDLGWCSADGYYTITGRARELIISGGYNIYPREVEEVLAGHPAIAEVAVLGLPDPEMGEQVVAAVVLKTGQTASDIEIIAFCRELLASYKKPRRVLFVDALPRNALGKVQKHVLAGQISN